MTLTRFCLFGVRRAGMRRAPVLAVLLASLSVVSVSAVELVGRPVALSSSSASADISQPQRVDENTQSGEPLAQLSAAPAPLSPEFNQPFGGHKQTEADGDNLQLQLIAIVFCVGGPLLLILTLVIMHYRAKERREKNINANIERLLAAGRDIPIELLRGDEPYVGPESALTSGDIQLQKGIRNVCLGVGLFICLTIFFGIKFGAIGFILLSMGVSQLWLWKLSNSKKDKTQNQG